MCSESSASYLSISSLFDLQRVFEMTRGLSVGIDGKKRILHDGIPRTVALSHGLLPPDWFPPRLYIEQNGKCKPIFDSFL
jgi:hypothetical protein